MKAELRKLYSLEIEGDMREYQPAQPDNFGTWVRLFVGPAEQPGAETFDLFVCTPNWLSDELERGLPAQWGRHLLIVKKYDLNLIVEQVEQMVGRVSEAVWQANAVKISRFAAWEFEDYRA